MCKYLSEYSWRGRRPSIERASEPASELTNRDTRGENPLSDNAGEDTRYLLSAAGLEARRTGCAMQSADDLTNLRVDGARLGGGMGGNVEARKSCRKKEGETYRLTEAYVTSHCCRAEMAKSTCYNLT